jgi:putative transposase
MYLPGYTYHLVQRGNNRQACFFEEENYRVYLRYMCEALLLYSNSLHAYCLMTNHVHLLLTPEHKDGISNLMKVVCSRYAQYINKKYSRTGTLWSGRHKSSAIDTENYLLKCYRYIELNPVAAKIVIQPEDYTWTSHHHNAWSGNDPLITDHESYRSLGKNQEQRCSSYRGLFRGTLSTVDYKAIRKATHYCMPLGSAEFIDQIERRIGRPLGFAKRGRPYSELVKNKSLRPL